MKTQKIICALYLLMWCVFNVTFASAMMVSRPIYVILFGLTLIYSIGVFRLKDRFPVYLKGLTLLLGMFVVYGMISICKGEKFTIGLTYKEIDSTIYLISVTKSILPIYAFYYLSKKGLLTEKSIPLWAGVFILAAIFQFFFAAMMIASRGHNPDTIVNGSGYTFVGIIPLLFFVKKDKLFWLYLAVLLLFVLMSAKRGAIVTCLLSAIYLIIRRLRTVKKSKRILTILGTVVFLIICYFVILRIYENNRFLQDRLEKTLEGNFSHRDVIVEDMLTYWSQKETIEEQILGLGASHTLEISENYAHNDWLEILINNGLLGVVIFIIYWSKTILQIRILPKNTSSRFAFVTLTIIGFLQTLFSMYYTNIATPVAICIAICLAQSSRSDQSEKIRCFA